jgi:beta-glucosidase
MSTALPFPADFVWGAATAAYQIEGAADADGKGPSVWDMFCRQPKAIWSGQNGATACDHYHRYQNDVALMRELGLKAYRLSISWPRVIPAGTGQLNAAGMDFYNRLIDSLLAAGITPFVTLFHWDYPHELYCQGGWLNPASPEWFAEYAGKMAAAFSDRVTHWMTLNEPQCFIGLGHQSGLHAPGLKLPVAEVLRAAHHVLLAHGKAVQALRGQSRQTCRIGFAPMGKTKIPATTSPADIEAARQAMFAVPGKAVTNNAWWMDPVFLGEYPADGVKLFGDDMPHIAANDMATIHQPLDFFGCNIYGGTAVTAAADGKIQEQSDQEGVAMSFFQWPMVPASLYWGPRFFYERYHAPIYITENGLSNTDWVARDGHVHDPQRIDFMARYLTELRRAMADKVDVRGYFHWSLMDNFEWQEGFKQRFGLIHVDYQTQQRTIKDSGAWYKRVIATNGTAL